MAYHIENEFLKIAVDEEGAELASIFDKKRSKERLWQGNPEYWSGRAPVLFPWCGRILDGELSYKGKKVKADRHGFARNSKFTLKNSKNSLLFELCHSDGTLAVYPYKFRLEIEYFLNASTVVQELRVYNSGNEKMPFSAGFHPGFALDKTSDWHVLFEKEESPVLIMTPGGFVSGEKKELFNKEKALTCGMIFSKRTAFVCRGLNPLICSWKIKKAVRALKCILKALNIACFGDRPPALFLLFA